MAVGLEGDAFFFEERALPLPAGSRATYDIDDTMARQQLCSGRVAKRAPHHAGVTRPTCKRGDEAVSHHPSARYLPHDAQHGITKRPRLFRCHFVVTVPRHVNRRKSNPLFNYGL